MRSRQKSQPDPEAPNDVHGAVWTRLVGIAPTMSVPALLREHGVDPARLLAEFGLDPPYFNDPKNTISIALRSRLLARCAEVTRCRHFGLLVGQRAGISSLGPVGFLMQRSPDVRGALCHALPHFWVHNRGAVAECVEHDAIATLSYTVLQSGVEDQTQLLYLAAATMFNVLRALCGHDWQPIQVQVAHARPRNLAPFRRHFQAPLVFDADETAIVFAGHCLDKPLPSADPLLYSMMLHRVSELELQYADGLHSEVRRMLPALISSRSASLPVAAKRLDLPVRTLTRRLAEEGTSFTRLREEARYAIAQQLLQGTRMPAQQVADHLGYANASAFTCAFRRWSGIGPAQWRVASAEE